MRRIAGWLEAALLLGGGALLLLWAVAALHQHGLAAWDRAAFEPAAEGSALHALPVAHAPEPAWREPLVDTTRWSAGRLAAYLATFEAPGALRAERLALLEIPAVDLSVVVLEGSDEWTLNRGVGRIAGTVRPGAAGNAGIAGHRDGFFRALERVKEGDVVRLTTPGSTEPRLYRIAWLRVVRPEDVWVLDPTEEPSLTLVTCHPFWFVGRAPDRFIVRAVALERPEDEVMAKGATSGARAPRG